MTDLDGQAPDAWRPAEPVWAPPEAPPPALRSAAALADEPAAGIGTLGGPARPVSAPPPLPVPLRPLTGWALYDGAFEILKARPRALLGAVAAVVLPVQAVAYLVRGGPYRLDLLAWAAWTLETGEDGSALERAFEERAALVWASYGLEVLATFLVGVVVARAVAGWYAGADPTAAAMLRDGLRRPGTLLGSFALSGLAKLVGLAVACVGVLLPAAWFQPLSPTLAVERTGAGASVRRSFQLANRRAGSVMGLAVGVAVVDQVVRLALGFLPWVLAGGLPDVAALAVRVVLVAGIALVSAVFVAGAGTLAYFDLRVRSEGLDLELEATDAFATPA